MKHATSSPKKSTATRKRKPAAPLPEQILRAALAPYVSLRRLRHLVARDVDAIHEALIDDQPPPEVQAIMHVLAAVLRPLTGDRIDQPSDVAALMLVEMSALTQEQLRVVYLSTKGRIQTIKTIYQGSLKEIPIRPIELFYEAVRRNSSSIILVHNHSSGDPTPSAEDMFITQHAQALGKLLGVKVLDHLMIGRGTWVSISEEFPMVLEQRTENRSYTRRPVDD